MQRAVPPGDGADLFIQNLKLIERIIAFICARHHLSQADSDDFASSVKFKFIESNYAAFTKFKGQCPLPNFLTIVIRNMFRDYRIAAWGKWRPSAEATRLGPLAVQLERLLVRDHHSLDEACEMLITNHRVTATRQELEDLAARLPVRVRRHFESDDALAQAPSTDRPPDEALETMRDHARTRAQAASALREIIRGFDPHDQLFLVLYFVDNKKMPEIAAILHIADSTTLYRHRDALLKRLREGLKARGIAAEAVMEMLESGALDLEPEEPPSDGGENGGSRPSDDAGAAGWP